MKFTHTNLPIEKDLPKLVRDNIPAIIFKNHKKDPQISIAKDDAEFVSYLLKKFVEEAVEVMNHTDREDLMKELADIKEVTRKLMQIFKISEKEVEEIRELKEKTNGGFEKRYILEKLPEGV